jgi:hypothetical protein
VERPEVRQHLADDAGSFCAAPTVVAGFMADEAERALYEWNRLVWIAMKARGLFVTETPDSVNSGKLGPLGNGQTELLWAPLRRNFFDRFGRR